jgi:hypothetical protein
LAARTTSPRASPAPPAFGLSGLFSTSSLHLFIPLHYRFQFFGGPPAGRPRIFFEKVVRAFSAHLFSACFISHNVSARPGGGGPQFFPLMFPLIFVLGVDSRYLRLIRVAGD